MGEPVEAVKGETVFLWRRASLKFPILLLSAGCACDSIKMRGNCGQNTKIFFNRSVTFSNVHLHSVDSCSRIII